MGLKVVIVSPEITPFAKTGGLADVAGSLPLALKRLGCDVTLFMPLYREVTEKGFDMEPVGVQVKVPIGRRLITADLFKGTTEGVAVYFLKRDEYYDRSYLYGTPEGDYFDNLERFVFFSRGVLEAVVSLGLEPDVVHCNDWQTGLVSAYIRSTYRSLLPGTATLFTIHNIAYQGIFPADLLDITGLPGEMYTMEGIEFWGKINLLKAGIVYSDVINTVSDGYSREIQTPEYGYGLEGILAKRSEDLFGVLNGVDYSVWNPETDELIASGFSSDDLRGKLACKRDLLREYSLGLKTTVPLIGVISRFAEQKGFDILAEAMDALMKLDIGMAILGTGEKRYQERFASLAAAYPKKLGVKVAFDNLLAHKIEAGSDMFLMPSRYEPCGLNQFYSLRYGTIPIVRATGGLDDTIKDYRGGRGNGFKFRQYSARALVRKVKEAVSVYRDKKAWRALQVKAMKEDFSWDRSASRYTELYKLAMEKLDRGASTDCG